jgi:tetratricopeptide (TPR) repeat protein
MRVFISSTSQDLHAYRAVVRDVVLDLGWQPVMMEHFGTAAGQGVVDACKERLAEADVVVAVIAWQRGGVPEVERGGDGKRSFTEIEVDAALESGKGVLLFLAKGSWPGDLWEEEAAARQQVKEWRRRLDRLAVFFEWEAAVADGAEALPVFRAKVRQELVRWHAPFDGPAGRPPRVRDVPHQRNAFFTGRGRMLTNIARQLHSGAPGPNIVILSGLGGVGKTQLVVEYLFRYGDDYDVVWWMDADEPPILADRYAALAPRLDPATTQTSSQAAAVATVRRWLEGHRRWALVFDNAKDPEVVGPYLPRSAGGHVLITSRIPDWGGLGVALDVQPFESREAVQFLRRRIGRRGERSGKGAAEAQRRELAEELGNLPLALEQAAAFAKASAMSPKSYLTLFRRRHRELLRHGKPLAYSGTVATTWEISFERLDARSPVAADLLRLCAFLGAEDLPPDVLADAADELPEGLAEAAADGVGLRVAVAELWKVSLGSSRSDGLSVHRLVQQIVRDRCDHGGTGNAWALVAVGVMGRAFSFDQNRPSTWQRSARLLPHALAALERASRRDLASTEVSRLLNATGEYLLYQGRLERSLDHFHRALAMDRSLRGGLCREVADRAFNISSALQTQGDLEGALRSAREALKVDEAVFGRTHPEVATDASNIAQILTVQRRLGEALRHARRALRIDRAAFGEGNPAIARDQVCIAQILQAGGDLAGALGAARGALAIDERVFGPDHPAVARDCQCLALICKEQGELQAALGWGERALGIDQEVFGAAHPAVARDLNCIGQVLHEQGEIERARECLQAALRLEIDILGERHPTVARVSSNLALLLLEDGDQEGALDAARRALGIDQEVYGPSHPAVGRDLHVLSRIRLAAGAVDAALESARGALAIDLEIYGDGHPNVASITANLAAVLLACEELDAALDAAGRALEIDQRVYGALHPKWARDSAVLGRILAARGERDEALGHLQGAAAVLERRLGGDHPRTREVVSCLAELTAGEPVAR